MEDAKFDKYFTYKQETKTLCLLKNIKEEIFDDEVDTYIRDNYDSDTTTLFIGKDVSDISNFIMRNHFYSSIEVDMDNNYFQSYNDCLLSKDLCDMYYCQLPFDKKNFTLPKGVKRIMPFCFNFEYYYFADDEIKLKNIIFNDELIELKENAFNGSFNGQRIFINKKLNCLNDNSFNCNGLDFQVKDNINFKIENGMLMYIPLKLVLKAEPEKIIENLGTILRESCKHLHSAILSAVDEAMSDISNNLNTTMARNLEQYLKQTKGIIADKETLLAYYNYYGNKNVLSIPEGILNIPSKANIGKIDKIIFPKSLKRVENRVFDNCGKIVEKPSLAFLGVEQFEVAKGNKNFYTDTKILYDLESHKVVAVAGKNTHFSQIIINNPLITQFNNGFYSSFISADELIFDNNFDIEIKGRIAPNANIKRIVFKSTRIKYCSKIFDYIRDLKEILVNDLTFAKNLYENVSKAHKNKIYCSDPSLEKDNFITYAGLNYYPITQKKTTAKTQNNYEKILQHINETPNFSRYSIAQILNVSPSSASAYLIKMRKMNLISDEII